MGGLASLGARSRLSAGGAKRSAKNSTKLENGQETLIFAFSAYNKKQLVCDPVDA